MSDNIFYVYEHWRPDTGVCFYVGKGKRRRAWNMKQRNVWHKSITSKLMAYGLNVDVRIVASELSSQESLILEIERIAFWGRDNLCNMSDGGDVGHNRNFTKEHKENLSLAWKRSVEQIKQMTAHLKGTKGRLGKPASEIVKKRLSEINSRPDVIEKFRKYMHLGPKSQAKPVVCVTDDIEFQSARAAGRHYGINSSAITGVCKKYKFRYTAGGRVFRFKDAA